MQFIYIFISVLAVHGLEYHVTHTGCCVHDARCIIIIMIIVNYLLFKGAYIFIIRMLISFMMHHYDSGFICYQLKECVSSFAK